eukprot:CAMPEP_0170738200 /NCGR_PEP_ID=MMETSP0437-20130122/4525_1 /TAXON_ID=0 /ORGANISM="Sexangularia sp." /LENGTH=1091 /DNA_ID=CAMNT_0011076621 /DNA_START=139 /DNA_END=3415 /DNA_ORIENTATION=+
MPSLTELSTKMIIGRAKKPAKKRKKEKIPEYVAPSVPQVRPDSLSCCLSEGLAKPSVTWRTVSLSLSLLLEGESIPPAAWLASVAWLHQSIDRPQRQASGRESGTEMSDATIVSTVGPIVRAVGRLVSRRGRTVRQTVTALAQGRDKPGQVGPSECDRSCDRDRERDGDCERAAPPSPSPVDALLGVDSASPSSSLDAAHRLSAPEPALLFLSHSLDIFTWSLSKITALLSTLKSPLQATNDDVAVLLDDIWHRVVLVPLQGLALAAVGVMMDRARDGEPIHWPSLRNVLRHLHGRGMLAGSVAAALVSSSKVWHSRQAARWSRPSYWADGTNAAAHEWGLDVGRRYNGRHTAALVATIAAEEDRLGPLLPPTLSPPVTSPSDLMNSVYLVDETPLLLVELQLSLGALVARLDDGQDDGQDGVADPLRLEPVPDLGGGSGQVSTEHTLPAHICRVLFLLTRLNEGDDALRQATAIVRRQLVARASVVLARSPPTAHSAARTVRALLHLGDHLHKVVAAVWPIGDAVVAPPGGAPRNNQTDLTSLLQHCLLEAANVYVNSKDVAPSADEAARLVAGHVHNVLTGKDEETRDEGAALAHLRLVVWQVVRSLASKDAYHASHGRLLARRLLDLAPINHEGETLVLSLLSDQMGFDYVLKLQRMYTDVTVDSAALCATFASTVPASLTAGLRWQVALLATGTWPLSLPPCSFVSPAPIDRLRSLFERRYLADHGGRKLTWMHHLERVEVHWTDVDRLLGATAHQAAVLTCFTAGPDGTTRTARQLQDATSLSDAALRVAVLGLVKTKVLRIGGASSSSSSSSPTAADGAISAGTMFTVATTAPSSARRINVAVPVRPLAAGSGDGDGATAANGDGSSPSAPRQPARGDLALERRMLLESAIVRLIKSKGPLRQGQLLGLTVAEVARFFKPKVSEVKAAIERTIDNEYLEHDAADSSLLRYVPEVKHPSTASYCRRCLGGANFAFSPAAICAHKSPPAVFVVLNLAATVPSCLDGVPATLVVVVVTPPAVRPPPDELPKPAAPAAPPLDEKPPGAPAAAPLVDPAAPALPARPPTVLDTYTPSLNLAAPASNSSND